MAEAFLTSDLAQGLLSSLVSLASEPIIRVWRLNDDLNNLKERMELVRALLSYAESKEMTMAEPVRLWLNKLLGVARDADALLDELAYEVIRQKVENHKVRKYLPRFKVAAEIKKINESLDGVYRKGEEIGLRPLEHLSSNGVENKIIRQTPPNVDDSQILGRGEDELEVVEMLCNSDNENDLSVVAIVGMGGLGKTALAQLVCKNEKVVNHFGKRMWITVSEDFDAVRILNEMVQSLTRSNPQLSNLEALVTKLQEALDGKKFLLVLDDMWNKSPRKWDEIRSCLLGISGAHGNKILITTRSSEVSRIMQSHTHPLVGLSDAHSWEIFKRRAFAIGGAIKTEKLEAIGKRMVKKCKGLPLALKTLGGSLYYKKTEHEWSSIEKNPRWDSTEVLPSLRISFDHLQPISLKHCFAYCSIFPKDFEIPKDHLVQQWMALGLFPHRRGCDLEDMGEEYFNILLWNSFLQDVERDEYNNIISCKMHDLVHDLSLDVSKKLCSTVEDNEVTNVLGDSIYVNLIGANNEILQKFQEGNFQRLQALYLDRAFPMDLLKKLKRLRILVVVGRDIKELPTSVGKLKHLRYLDVSGTRISTLPYSITKLFHLQALRAYHLQELPKMFENLINLRHLYFKFFRKSENSGFIVRIRKLTLLRTLQFFVVNRAKGCQLEELEGLDNLTSTLELYGLGDVKGIEEARKAKLNTKSRIQAFGYNWQDNEIRDISTKDKVPYNDKDVLQGLEPHSSVKGLKIKNFMGKNFASWMMKVSQSLIVLHNLVKIKLVRCKNCVHIPTLGHLPYLKVIEIKGMSTVKCIGADFYGFSNNDNRSDVASSSSSAATLNVAFPTLERLSLEDMEDLEEWAEAVGRDHPSSPSNLIQAFPRLEDLEIIKCPKLLLIPSHFPALIFLQIRGINASMALEKMSLSLSSLRELWFSGVGGSKVQFVLEEFLGNNTSLQIISIEDCEQLTELRTDCLQFCMSLERLSIRSCSALVSVPDLQCLTRLTKLRIGPLCPELDYFPWPFPYSSLQTLTIEGWPKLKSLPDQLQHLSALTWLHVYSSALVSVPDLRGLTRLTELSIAHLCKELDYFPWPFPHSSLQRLNLHGWPKLKSLPDQLQYLSALTHLHLCSFDGLETLPDWLGNLLNLQYLSIIGGENLMNMPSVEAMQCLRKLKTLQINWCPLVDRCAKGSGSEWSKIAHVPNILIDVPPVQALSCETSNAPLLFFVKLE